MGHGAEMNGCGKCLKYLMFTFNFLALVRAPFFFSLSLLFTRTQFNYSCTKQCYSFAKLVLDDHHFVSLSCAQFCLTLMISHTQRKLITKLIYNWASMLSE